MKIQIFAASLILAGSATAGQAGVIFAPVGATIDAGGPGFGDIADTYNQNGLSSNYIDGITDFDTYIATNPTHTLIFSGNEWFSNDGTSTATVTYDFGAIKTFDALALWNEESSGIGQLALSTSWDGINFSALTTVSPFDNPLADYPAQIFGFGSVSAQYVRFDMSGCPQPDPGTFAGCAIGEVAFRSSQTAMLPEPAAWAMMLGGFGMIGGAMRARRRASLSFG